MARRTWRLLTSLALAVAFSTGAVSPAVGASAAVASPAASIAAASIAAPLALDRPPTLRTALTAADRPAVASRPAADRDGRDVAAYAVPVHAGRRAAPVALHPRVSPVAPAVPAGRPAAVAGSRGPPAA
ncbi:hypothetical protein [Micromonospora sp. PLK6-60]|uniref:hypothetical protein n=1 Tax=Micromonospora sp. PLK6-60 TaxID=2873383 RepID=UPI0027E0F85C|nr:hypothetical protein [Micromonospora sp. PLK6-60]